MTWGALELCAEAGKCNTLPQLRLGARGPGRSSAAAGACATGCCWQGAAGARVTRTQAGHTLHWRLEVVRASEGGVESIVAGEGVGAGGADEGAWRVT
jgi:hypothetical protein